MLIRKQAGGNCVETVQVGLKRSHDIQILLRKMLRTCVIVRGMEMLIQGRREVTLTEVIYVLRQMYRGWEGGEQALSSSLWLVQTTESHHVLREKELVETTLIS